MGLLLLLLLLLVLLLFLLLFTLAALGLLAAFGLRLLAAAFAGFLSVANHLEFVAVERLRLGFLALLAVLFLALDARSVSSPKGSGVWLLTSKASGSASGSASRAWSSTMLSMDARRFSSSAIRTCRGATAASTLPMALS